MGKGQTTDHNKNIDYLYLSKKSNSKAPQKYVFQIIDCVDEMNDLLYKYIII